MLDRFLITQSKISYSKVRFLRKVSKNKIIL